MSRRAEARGTRVDVVVNDDHVSIQPELMDDDTAMVQGLIDRFYARGPRYAARDLLQARLERGTNTKTNHSAQSLRCCRDFGPALSLNR